MAPIDPPESEGGKVATSLGILAVGAALGAGAGALYMPSSGKVGSMSAKGLGATIGALLGAGLTGMGALALAEFVGGDWQDVERMTALLGAGGAGALVAASAVKELVGVKGALEAPGGAPQLAPGGSGAARTPQTYSATASDSGRTLTMAPGDSLSVVLPSAAASAPQWQWAASPGLITIASQTLGTDLSNNVVETTVLVAQVVGAGQVQAQLPDGSATFFLNVNVQDPTA